MPDCFLSLCAKLQPTNRLTSNITYDDAGNVTIDQKFRGLRYRYDANGRMWKSANVDNTGESTSVYDGLGQRVQTTDSNNTKTLVYDAFGRLVSEYDTQAQTGSGTKYLMSDLQGSARVLTNESGTVIARHDYQAFGGEIGATIGLRTTDQKYNASDSTRQRYALTERDATGLDHTGWRKYDNSSGRWTSPDLYNGSMLLSDPQSFNRYVYVHNDPINFVDSVGAQETPTDGGPISFPIPYTVNPDGSISTTFNIEVGPYGTVWNLPSGVSGGGRGIHPPLQGTDTEEGTGHGGGGGNDPNGRDHKQNSVQHKKGKSFLDALNYCIRDYYGLDKLLKRGGIAAALFPLTKKMIGVKRLGNASRYVPVISWLGWKLFPNANTAFKTFGTFRFFGQLGRGYLPLLGATLTLFDALAISLCVSEQMNR